MIIIEDLDRFKDTEIFTKLRELNTLINNSDQVGQRVVFIYAIKDDMFLDKENRTKFFDRIIPVIPVINSSNSKEELRKRLTRLNLIDSISDELINDISLYIDDMRILVNTVNEYALYKKKIPVNLGQDKLFGMIVYKNTHPADFTPLHYNQGVVYRIFERKREYVKDVVSKIESEQKEITEKIKKIEKTHLQSISELRAVYVFEFFKDHLFAGAININGLKQIGEIISDKNFPEYKRQKNIQYAESRHHGSKSSSISFQDLEKKINPEKTYEEREFEINDKCNNEIEQLRRKVEEYSKEKRIQQHASLKEMMERHTIEEVEKEIGENRLLKYLIRYGYIDEMYHSYISYFYEGSLTREDMDFVLSVKNQDPKNFDYELTKIDGITERLQIGDYRRESVLNYELIDHLLEIKENHEKELNAVIEQISNKSKSAISFMNGYLENGNRISEFVHLLAKIWLGWWKYIERESEFSIEKKNQYLQLILSHADLEDMEALNRERILSNYISSKKDFLSLTSDIELDKLQKTLLKLNVKFKYLDNISVSEELFDFIYENSLYQINERMIALIIKEKQKEDTDLKNLKFANYTTIKQSGCSYLIEYIESHIDDYVENVLLAIESNTDESKQSLVHLLNHEKISEELKEEIVLKENTKFTDLKQVGVELWEVFFRESKITATWENVKYYYQHEERLAESLIAYLNQPFNYSKLSDKKITKEESEEEVLDKLLVELVLCNEINDDSYDQLLKGFLFSYRNLKFESLLESKVDLLIENNMLSLTKENYQRLKENFNNKHISLIEAMPQDFLKQSEEYALDESDYKILLQSDELDYEYKSTLIKQIDEALITDENDLANQICDILKHTNQVNISFRLIDKIISYSTSIDKKIKLLSSQVLYLAEDNITDLLRKLGEPYDKLTGNGGYPRIENNRVNLSLISELKERKYISTYSEKGKYLKVNLRKVER